MPFFLLTFFSIYGSFHLYAFLKARAAFAFGWRVGTPLALLMLLMIAAPVLIRLAEGAGMELVARFLAYLGYSWLGLLFLFVGFGLALDLWRLVLAASCRLGLIVPSFLKPEAGAAFLLPTAIAVLIGIYGHFEARRIRLETVRIETPHLAAGEPPFRIVQISDVHLGLIVRHQRLRLILEEVDRARPDLLVSTGDLVDGQISRLTGLAEMLSEIQPPFGKYAITGNHEFYAGLDQALSFTRRAGFTILRDQGVTLPGGINLVGVDDRTARYDGPGPGPSEPDLLASMPSDGFTLLLKHRPLLEKQSLGHFDLQLSGHTHKGQLFPFNIVTWLYYPTHAGCLQPVDGCFLYVSRGSGTWGPPIRFLSPPEVTLFELVPLKK